MSICLTESQSQVNSNSNNSPHSGSHITTIQRIAIPVSQVTSETFSLNKESIANAVQASSALESKENLQLREIEIETINAENSWDTVPESEEGIQPMDIEREIINATNCEDREDVIFEQNGVILTFLSGHNSPLKNPPLPTISKPQLRIEIPSNNDNYNRFDVSDDGSKMEPVRTVVDNNDGDLTAESSEHSVSQSVITAIAKEKTLDRTHRGRPPEAGPVVPPPPQPILDKREEIAPSSLPRTLQEPSSNPLPPGVDRWSSVVAIVREKFGEKFSSSDLWIPVGNKYFYMRAQTRLSQEELAGRGEAALLDIISKTNEDDYWLFH